MDLALVSVAVLLTLGPGGKTFGEVRIGLGSVAPTPIRAREAEKRLVGEPVVKEAIQEAAEVASRECVPITDLRPLPNISRHSSSSHRHLTGITLE